MEIQYEMPYKLRLYVFLFKTLLPGRPTFGHGFEKYSKNLIFLKHFPWVIKVFKYLKLNDAA